ncbi:MAG: flagellar hook-basal body complex protein [Rhodobacteraceae bacterium]|nr:flagellar hook-basal body complex protein [Paracoccaceae bacterium]
MDNTTYIALSRQQALWNQLEVVANNLANANTVGFKGSDTLFSQYVVKVDQDERAFKDKVAFVHDFGLVRNLAQGTFFFTGNTFDLSIQGEGYFVTEATSATGRGPVTIDANGVAIGADGLALNSADNLNYTRAGAFSVDSDGFLVTMEGRRVLNTNNSPISIPPDAREVLVQGDGTIAERGGRTFGTLRVVRFDNERELKQVDGTGFRADGQQPIDLDNPKVGQGVLENSNVNPVIEMTRLIALNRAYQDNARMITQEDERKKKANEVFTRTVSA